MYSFRPLDGESISKLLIFMISILLIQVVSFRPLDGESISKREVYRINL